MTAEQMSVKNDHKYRASAIRRTLIWLVLLALAFYFGIMILMALR